MKTIACLLGFLLCFLSAEAQILGEWNGLRFYAYGKDTVDYPYHGTNPLCKVLIVNAASTVSPKNIAMIVTTSGVQGNLLNTFPNGGKIMVLRPGDSTIVSCWLQEIYQRPATPFTEGEYRNFDIKFSFIRDKRDAPAGDSTVMTRKIVIHYAGRNPVTFGSFAVAGRIILPVKPLPALRVTPATLNWHSSSTIPLVPGDSGYSFSTTIGDRDDWYLEIAGDNVKSRIVKIDRANAQNMRIEVEPGAQERPLGSFELRASVETTTGFWRGVGSDAEQTVCVFPGQENWNKQQDSVLRAGCAIYKYGFDGTKKWSYNPGWETWGGDMSADGRYVAYALYTGGFANAFRPPATVVMLNGLTGEKIWEKSGSPLYESYEVAFSPNADYLAVGTTGSGQVSLMYRSTGDIIWSAPLPNEREAGQGFGQVRRIRFDPSGEYLYAGSGDNYLRKIRVSDGAIVWRTLIGGWPFVNGLHISKDGKYLSVGTKSAQACLVRAEDGALLWTHDTGNFDEAYISPDNSTVATFSGKHFDAASGELIGRSNSIAIGHFTADSKFIYRMPAELQAFAVQGITENPYQTHSNTTLAKNPGEQSQWSFLSADNTVAVVAARDMTNSPQTGLLFYHRTGASDVTEQQESIEQDVQVVPHPFNDNSMVHIALTKQAEVSVRVYTILGRLMASLPVTLYMKGHHQIPLPTVPGNNLYILRLEIDGAQKTLLLQRGL
ncbi:MAG: PQQ-binding-like beta-propeller repeat protein [Candidatus Kapaibacterium sp.]